MEKKKILITGSNGLLGQKLVHLLRAQPDVELIATARGENRLAKLFPDLEYSALDITNAADVESVVAKYRPHFLIHSAAMTNVDECESDRQAAVQINVDGVRNIVAACQNHQVHLIHVSTDFIFDGEAGPYDEKAQPAPVNFYGETKLRGEEIVINSTIKWAIARTVLVYGTLLEGSRSNIVLWVKGSLEKGQKLKLVDDQLRSPTLAEDLAMGCWLIAKKGATGVYNISGKDLLTPYQMAHKVANVFGLDTSLIEMTDSSTLSQPAKRPPRTGFIIDKAKKELGYEPHSFEEGIRLVAGQVRTLPGYQAGS